MGPTPSLLCSLTDTPVGDGHPVDAQEATYHVHVYKTVDNYVELSGGLDEDEEEQEANTSAASVRDLPARELEGLWDKYVPPCFCSYNC